MAFLARQAALGAGSDAPPALRLPLRCNWRPPDAIAGDEHRSQAGCWADHLLWMEEGARHILALQARIEPDTGQIEHFPAREWAFARVHIFQAAIPSCDAG